jgi:hypothetical protein
MNRKNAPLIEKSARESDSNTIEQKIFHNIITGWDIIEELLRNDLIENSIRPCLEL